MARYTLIVLNHSHVSAILIWTHKHTTDDVSWFLFDQEVGVVHRRWHLWRRIYDLYLG
jgi:hypothetical protein